jgi:CBS-domain-containing membrane protein
MMTRNVECIRPANSIIDAARQMKKLDVGVLPVCGVNDRLVGMIRLRRSQPGSSQVLNRFPVRVFRGMNSYDLVRIAVD